MEIIRVEKWVAGKGEYVGKKIIPLKRGHCKRCNRELDEYEETVWIPSGYKFCMRCIEDLTEYPLDTETE
jgi:hypothetical protein